MRMSLGIGFYSDIPRGRNARVRSEAEPRSLEAPRSYEAASVAQQRCTNCDSTPKGAFVSGGGGNRSSDRRCLVLPWVA